MSNQDKGADGRSCPRARWLIALFWLNRATVPKEWPIRANYVECWLRDNSEAMREVLEDIPCTVPGCGFCGRPMTRGIAGNMNSDHMDKTFQLDGRNFRVVIHEQGTGKNILEWLPASSRDIPHETLAGWLEEMARRVREGEQ